MAAKNRSATNLKTFDKEEAVTVLTPLFEKQSLETGKQIDEFQKSIVSSVAQMFEYYYEKLDNKITGVKVLVEQLDKKFEEALVHKRTTSEHNVKIKDFDERIDVLEVEVHSLKTVVNFINKT